MKKKWVEYIFVFICLLILGFLLLWGIRSESLTYDELTYTNAGYGFLTKHDFRLDPFSPPLAREITAFPLLFNKSFGNDILLFWPRVMVVVTTLLLGIFVYLFARKLFGKKAAMLSLFLFIFEPNILANGHYATMDLIFTFFFFLSIFLLHLWRENFTIKRLIFFGIVLGFTLSTKITALPFFLLTFLGLFLYEKRKESLKFFKCMWKQIFFGLFVIFLSLWSTYFFTFEPFLGYRFDTHRPAVELAKNNPLIKIGLTVPLPLGSYINTIKELFVFNYSHLYTKNSFFMGKISTDGFYGFYFPIAMLFKTPLPLLTLFFVSCMLFRINRRNSYLLIPILAILLSVFFSKVTLVIRYVLPLYPFFIIYASQILLIKLNKFSKVVLSFLLVWYIVGTLTIAPHFISYFNEIAGGYRNGYKILIDANDDWGQGLIDLANFEKSYHTKTIQLAYFGGAYAPSKYGVEYTRLKDMSLNETKKVKGPEFHNNTPIIISSTCWYFCGYYKDPLFKNKQPDGMVANSLLYFRNE